jgi:transposase
MSSEALALWLHQAGHTVSVVNPAAIKAFAASRLSRTKTDKVDAELIARFCQAQQPPGVDAARAGSAQAPQRQSRLATDPHRNTRTIRKSGEACGWFAFATRISRLASHPFVLPLHHGKR